MPRLDLETDEAILLDALAKYASTEIKPPLNAELSEIKATHEIAVDVVFAAPEEVMQRLARKLNVVYQSIRQERPKTVASWMSIKHN